MARWPLTPTLSLALALALSLALALAQRMGLAPFVDDDEASARGARGSGTHPTLARSTPLSVVYVLVFLK